MRGVESFPPPLFALTLLPPEGWSPGRADLASLRSQSKEGRRSSFPQAEELREGEMKLGQMSTEPKRDDRPPQDEVVEVQLPHRISPQRRRISGNPTVKSCARRPSSPSLGT